VRGESAYLLEGEDHYLAHVEEGLGTKNLVADAVRNANAAKQGSMLLRKNTPLARDEDLHTVMYRFVFPVKKK